MMYVTWYSVCTLSLVFLGNSYGHNLRFTRFPPPILYVERGHTGRFEWNYTVEDKNTQFDSISPQWLFFVNNTIKVIAYDSRLNSWNFVVSPKDCPDHLKPRLKKKSKATLVITGVIDADNGKYGCKLKLANSSEIISTSVLIVTNTPKLTVKPDHSISIKEHSELNVICNAVGPPSPNVTWIRNNTKNAIIQGVGSATLRIKNITRNQGGTYKCLGINNPNLDPVIKNVVVLVNYPPQFLTTPRNTTAEKGDKLHLICNTTAIPHPVVHWSRENNKPFNRRFTKSDETLTIKAANESDAGWYICTAMNRFGGQNYSATRYAYVVVKYPPTIVSYSSKLLVNENDPVTLTCKATGFPVPSIEWTRSTGDITPRHIGQTYTIANVNKSDNGTYTCTAYNGVGNNATAEVEVIVQYKPTIDKELSNSIAESWNGHEITLTCKYSTALPMPKWNWFNPDGANITSLAVDIRQGSNIKVTTEISGDYGIYTCRASNLAGSDIHSINVTRLLPPGSPSFNVTNIEASSAVVRWTEPVDNGGSKVNGYKVEIDSKTHNITDLGDNSFTISGLTKNNVYIVKLYAKNIVGYGNASSKTFTTKKEGPPASPFLTIVKVSPTEVTLSWSKPEENGGEIEYYTIYKKLAGENEWSQVGTLEGAPLTYTVKDLLPGKTYSFHVTAKNKDGSSLTGVNEIPVTLPVETTTPPTTSAIGMTTVPSKGKSSGGESDPNQPIIIAGAVVAVVLIAITAVISIVILRKKNKFGKSGKKRESNQQSAAYHNDVDCSDSIGRGAAVVTLNDDSASTYAAVDMTKKTKKKDEIPNYAAVDKSKKKKKPGEIIYAELADFNTSNVPAAPRPAQYTETDYADISQFQNQVEAEPTYANFPGRSKDYNI